MGDEDKTLDAVDEPIPQETTELSDSAVTVDVEDAAGTAGDEAPKLRLAKREGEDGGELLGAPPEPDEMLGDDEQAGISDVAPRKKGLAALFGGAKSSEGVDADDDTPKWVLAGARPKRQGSGIRVVNRVLALAVIVILVFGVLDLSATIRQAPGGFAVLGTPIPVDDLATNAGSGPSGGVPPLANLLESFAKRPIVRDLDRSGFGEVTAEVVRTRAQVPDWKVAAQKLDLIGLSGAPNGEMEAIVVDREAGRMHILKVGQDMMVGESQLKLARIATDHVAFEKDGDEVIVK